MFYKSFVIAVVASALVAGAIITTTELLYVRPTLGDHKPLGSTNQCNVNLAVQRLLSPMGVTGNLGGLPLILDKKTLPGPEGRVDVSLSTACPASDDDLVEPFTFTMRSTDSLIMQPQSGIVVIASKAVQIVVKNLQLRISTTMPIPVSETEFNQPDGMLLEVTSGIAQVVTESFDISGLSAVMPLAGYFTTSSTGELELHVLPSPAEFPVQMDEPPMEGSVIFTAQLVATGRSLASRMAESGALQELVESAVSKGKAKLPS